MRLGMRKGFSGVPERCARLAAVVVTVTLGPGAAARADAASALRAPGLVARAGWPLFFEAGPQSANGPADFVARGPNYQLRVMPSGVDFVLRHPHADAMPYSVRREQAVGVHAEDLRSVRMTFVSANPRCSLSGGGQLDGKVNYLLGNDPAKWRTQVPVFAQVKTASLYPGFDLVYYGNHQQLEYDFTVAPRADANSIALRFDGIDKLALDPSGELVI